MFMLLHIETRLQFHFYILIYSCLKVTFAVSINGTLRLQIFALRNFNGKAIYQSKCDKMQ